MLTPPSKPKPRITEVRESDPNQKYLDLLDRVHKRVTTGRPHAEKDAVTNKCKCLCGEKDLPMDEIKVATHIKGVRLMDFTCADCRKFSDGYSRIYCLGCKALLLRRPPIRLKNGFVFERNKAYHVKSCPKCNDEHFKLVSEVEKKIAEDPNREESLRALTRVQTIEESYYEKHRTT